MWSMWVASFVLIFSVSLVASRASAEPQKLPSSLASRSKSVGSPDQGVLVGGRKLAPSPNLRAFGSHRYGLAELVDLLTRSASKVAKRYPGSILNVGDLSRRGGGEVDGHRSHESGRDADVGFYLTKGGKQFVAPRFATVAADGSAVGFPGVRFDDARNWSLVELWLADQRARVLQIFVSNGVKQRLLTEAARVGASQALQARAAQVLFQPTRGLPHDNHFHIRIACPTGQRECVNFGKHARLKLGGKRRAARTSGPKPARR